VKTVCKNGNIVEHWYDRKTRSSVTQVNDPEGNQIGDAQFSGNRTTAQATRKASIKDNGGAK